MCRLRHDPARHEAAWTGRDHLLNLGVRHLFLTFNHHTLLGVQCSALTFRVPGACACQSERDSCSIAENIPYSIFNIRIFKTRRPHAFATIWLANSIV